MPTPLTVSETLIGSIKVPSKPVRWHWYRLFKSPMLSDFATVRCNTFIVY